MTLTGSRTYVGFGLGPIQAGLFLYEAFRSGHFARLVVAEVAPPVVNELRAAGGSYRLNIAHPDHVETTSVGPVEAYNPSISEDRERVAATLAEAHEIGTAVPSVESYVAPGEGSLHRVLAAGLTRKVFQSGPRAVVYTAENDNAAAETLERLVLGELPEPLHAQVRSSVQFLNTVIGKMSGLVADPDVGATHASPLLPTATPRGRRAFLVEAFNRILISKIRFDPPFERGITVFDEKENLLPFEEAKLFGHNATHALAAYLGRLMRIQKIAELRSVPGMVPFLRDAFLYESGEALIRRHRGVDRLFTREGYAEYAENLLDRMTNPFLMDTVERVARDPQRKLGWNDRLVGTMRLALSEGIEPRRYAIGAAAACAALSEGVLDGRVRLAELALQLWSSSHPEQAEREKVLALVDKGARCLQNWRKSGFPDLEKFFENVS